MYHPTREHLEHAHYTMLHNEIAKEVMRAIEGQIRSANETKTGSE